MNLNMSEEKKIKKQEEDYAVPPHVRRLQRNLEYFVDYLDVDAVSLRLCNDLVITPAQYDELSNEHIPHRKRSRNLMRIMFRKSDKEYSKLVSILRRQEIGQSHLADRLEETPVEDTTGVEDFDQVDGIPDVTSGATTGSFAHGTLHMQAVDVRNGALIELEVSDVSVKEVGSTQLPGEVSIMGGLVQHQGEYYFFGGWRGYHETQDGACKYNSITKTWMTLPHIPFARKFSAAFAMNGRIYVTGGAESDMTNEKVSPTVQSFDPIKSKWTFLSDLPVSLRCHAAVVHDDTAYFSGGKGPLDGGTDGYFGDGYHSSIYKYNKEKDTWSDAGKLYQPRANHAMISYDKDIFIVGGRNVRGPVLDIERYTPETQQCTKLSSPQLPCGMKYNNACAQNGQHVYFRGVDDKLHCFDIVQKTVTTLEASTDTNAESSDFNYLMIVT